MIVSFYEQLLGPATHLNKMKFIYSSSQSRLTDDDSQSCLLLKTSHQPSIPQLTGIMKQH